MIIIGHRFIPSKNFYHVQDIDAINNTPPSSCITVEFNEQNLDIINHATLNNVELALSVKNVTELIYAANLGATYIIVEKELAQSAQKIANEYLFDAKLLVSIQNEEEIETLALQSVDGAIFSNAIIKTPS